MQARHVAGADDRTSHEAVPGERGGELVEARPQLEVDVQPDPRRLVDEEGERLVERGQLGRDLAQLLERVVAYPSRRDAVADLVQVVRVGDDERSAGQVEHVELDQVDVRGRGARNERSVFSGARSAAPR